MKYLATVNETTFEVVINEDSYVTVDGQRHEIDFRAVGNGPLYSLLIGGNSYEGHIEGIDDGWQVLHKGDLYIVEIEDERSQRLMKLGGAGIATKGDYYLKAPMPGLVVSVPVKEGQEITIKVIGQRFELNDKYISIISEILEPKEEVIKKRRKPRLVIKA